MTYSTIRKSCSVEPRRWLKFAGEPYDHQFLPVELGKALALPLAARHGLGLATKYFKIHISIFPILRPWIFQPLQSDPTRDMFSTNMGLAPPRPIFRSILTIFTTDINSRLPHHD